MDSWKALLRLMCKLIIKNGKVVDNLPLYQRVGTRVVVMTMKGYGWKRRSIGEILILEKFLKHFFSFNKE